MNRYWSAIVHALTPYVPGEQPKLSRLIKLNTNENPYGPSPRALEAICATADARLRLYPDPNADQLRSVLAQRFGLQPGQIFVGNGSDEVLAHAFMGLLRHDHALWMPDITYSFYPTYCGLYDIRYELIPLDAEYGIQARDYLPQPGRQAGAIIFANPNAPTGRPLPLDEVEQIVAGNPQAVVVVDEAYVDFGGTSAASHRCCLSCCGGRAGTQTKACTEGGVVCGAHHATHAADARHHRVADHRAADRRPDRRQSRPGNAPSSTPYSASR